MPPLGLLVALAIIAVLWRAITRYLRPYLEVCEPPARVARPHNVAKSAAAVWGRVPARADEAG